MMKLFASYAGISVVMAALTLVLAGLSSLLGKRFRAKSLYIAWIVVLLGFLIPLRIPNLIPAVTATAPAAITRPVAEAATREITAIPQSTAALPGVQETAAAAVQPRYTAPFTWMHLITVVWLIGTAAALAVYGIRHLLFLRNIRRWRIEIVNETTRRILAEELRRAGIKKTVKLYRCPGIGSPMMTGMWKPALLLPDEELTEEELPLVFRHELVHLKRHDLLVKALLLLAAALHWFNPAVYVLVKQLTFWQESACDEAVIRSGSMADKQFYSETIIRVIRRQMRMKTALSTSFYGGKSGMKRRITGIMESGSKHSGAVLWLVMLLLVSCLGMAFATEAEPVRETAYVTSMNTDGARMMTVPSVNDWEVPICAYFNGTQVTVTETRESSVLPEWNSTDGEANWAHVLVGGDGTATGISGWIPLFFLSDTQPAALPAATLTTDSPTGFVSVYTQNDTESDLIDAWQEGTEVTLVGRVQQWYQIIIDGTYGFVQRENLAVDDAVQARFDTFLPFRFDGITRAEYQSMITFSDLLNAKKTEYDGKEIEYWSPEDKAWYGQMEDTYVGMHDYYYQLPQAGDLSQEQAVDIAWTAFTEHDPALADANRDDYDIYRGFYSIPTMEEDKKRWEIRICPKGETRNYYLVNIDSPSGEVLDTYGSI